MLETYCLKCKAKREIKNPVTVIQKNGKPGTQGTCPTCGSKLFKMGVAAK